MGRPPAIILYSMTMNPACAVCSTELDQVSLRITELDRFERALEIPAEGYERTWRTCAVCGTARNVASDSVREKVNSIAEQYYEIDFGSTTPAERFAKIMAIPMDKSDNSQRVLRIREYCLHYPLSPIGRRKVLDIGAGLGVFLARFVTDQWEATAVEPDPKNAAHLREIGQNVFHVVEGLYEGQPELGDQDLVTLNKVVEHVARPVEFIQLCQQALNPARGLMYIEVPDVLNLTLRPPNDNSLGVLHHHLYDVSSLATLFARAGMVCLQSQRVLDPSGKLTVCGFGCLPEASARLAASNQAR